MPESKRPHDELAPNEMTLLEEAYLYRNFPEIKVTLDDFLDVLEKRRIAYAPGFADEMRRSLENLQKAVEIVNMSLDTQKRFNLVDKRWVRSDFAEVMSGGKFAMEMDVRMDKDGEFWISHAVGARATFFPPLVNTLTTEEMKLKGKRLNLADSLKEFIPYAKRGHRLILEIKTLGPDTKKFEQSALRLKKMLEDNGVEDSVSIASLSPGILFAIHKAMPRIPLILNGGLLPVFSYQESASPMKRLVGADESWRAFGMKPFGEVVFSANRDLIQRADGEGVQTGYVLATIPDELLRVLRQQKVDKARMGGIVSVAGIDIAANAMRLIGADESAAQMSRYYADVVRDLGVNIMSGTWGQELGSIPGLVHLSPEEQIKAMRKFYGPDILIYTKNPETTAIKLAKNVGDDVKGVIGEV